MNEEEIKALPPCLRILGYLKRQFEIHEHELKLKHKYQTFDNTWQIKAHKLELMYFNSLVDDSMPWWYALDTIELNSIYPFELMLKSLVNNEFPFKTASKQKRNSDCPFPVEISNS